MSFIRQQHEVRNVGGQPVPVYCPDIDESLYDERIRAFCVKYFNEDEKRYVIPQEDKKELALPKNYFFMFLYLILQAEKIVVRGRNLRPFMDRMKAILVEPKYLVDRTALSRLQSSWGDDMWIIVSGVNPQEYSNARKKQMEEFHPDFVRMRRAWQQDQDPLNPPA